MTDLEFLREYAKCGIHHNHAHNESNLKHKLQILDAAISAIDMLYKRLAIYEDQWLPSKQEQIDELSDKFDALDDEYQDLVIIATDIFRGIPRFELTSLLPPDKFERFKNHLGV